MRGAVLALAIVAMPALAHADRAKPAAKGKTLPGTVGLTSTTGPIVDACAPTFRSIARAKPGDDDALVAALTFARLTGLTFDMKDDDAYQRDVDAMIAWEIELNSRLDRARVIQLDIARAEGATAKMQVESFARMGMMLDQANALFASAEIPRALRGDAESTATFCDSLRAHAEPLRYEADRTAALCRKVATDKLRKGWWVSVCKR